MKIHEYQAKQILREHDVPVPRGKPAFSVDEAVAVARELGGPVWVVKAQIHAGGRKKAAGSSSRVRSTRCGSSPGRFWACSSSPTRPGRRGRRCGGC